MHRRKLLFSFAFIALLLVSCSLTPDISSFINPTPTVTAVLINESTPTSIQPSITITGDISQMDAVLINLYKRASPGIVSLVVTNNEGMVTGSGFVFDKVGHIVTNYHVIENATLVEVDFPSGLKVDANIIGKDLDSDLAVLKVEADTAELIPLVMGDSDQLKVGQMVVSIGSPFFLTGSMSLGIVSAKGRMLDSLHTTTDLGTFSSGDIIQTDAAINPGNSGGPLFNLTGEVIGVNRAISTNSYSSNGEPVNSGIGFAVSANIVKRVVPSLITYGSYDYPYLGISSSSYDLTLEEWKALGLNETSGVYIGSVTRGGPADQAGLRGGTVATTISGLKSGGDLIMKVDDRPVLMYSDLISYIMANKSPNDPIVLTILRDGEQIEITLVLGSRP